MNRPDPHALHEELAAGHVNRPDPHALYEELAAGHALGALEPEDEQLFLLHLPGCARCEADLAWHRETAAQLAYAAAPAELPAGLFDRIRTAVVAESGEEAFAPLPGPADVPAQPAVQAGNGSVVQLGERRRRRLPRAVALTSVAAGVALVLALVGSNLALRQERQQQLAWSDRLAEAVDTISASPGVNVPLRDDASRVTAVAVLHGDRVSLVVDGLPANDQASTTYVLWEVTKFGGKQAVGTFDVRDGGVEVLRDLPLHTPAGDVAAFAVTREQGDTAPAAPQSAPLVVGEVDQA